MDGDEQAAVRAAFDLSYTALAREARRLVRLLGLVPGPEVTAVERWRGWTPSGPTCSPRCCTPPSTGRGRWHGCWPTPCAATSGCACTPWTGSRSRMPAWPPLRPSGTGAPAAAHLSIADVSWRQSRGQQAVEHYSQALALNRATGWSEGQAAALGNLGNVYWRSGKLEQATSRYLEALALNRQIGWLEGQVVNLSNLGMVCWEQGRLEEAAAHAAEALALYRRFPQRRGARAQQPG